MEKQKNANELLCLLATKRETQRQELADVAKVQYCWWPRKGLNTASSKPEYIPKFKVMHTISEI